MKNMHALAIWLQLLLAWIPFVYLFVVDFRLGKAMAKRLRGWQLEQESGRKAIKGNKALEKATALEKADGLEKHESPLASKLLHLWASGSLSAVMVRELANLALQDGADHPELVKLAQCGNWGAQPGNCHRQILNKFCSDVMLPEPFSIKVKCIDPKTSLEKEDWASLFLPHQCSSKKHFVSEKTICKNSGLGWRRLEMIEYGTTPCVWKSTGGTE